MSKIQPWVYCKEYGLPKGTKHVCIKTVNHKTSMIRTIKDAKQ